MGNDNLEQALKQAIPENLDNIIREHRDRLTLRMSTADELTELPPMVSMLGEQIQMRATIKDWWIVCLDQNQIGKNFILVGTNESTDEVWATSAIKSVDFENGLVLTDNSVYRLGQKGDGEPTFPFLLHLCSQFHKWGFGPTFGVPHIFY